MTGSFVLDIVVLAILVIAAFAGWRRGFFRSVFSALGLIAGGIAAFLLLPTFAGWASTPGWRIAIVIGGGILLLAIGQGIGSFIGRILRRGIDVIKLSFIDRIAGLATSVVVAGLVIGTVATGIASLGVPVVTQSIAGSTAIGTIDRLTPTPAKAFLAQVRTSTVSDAVPWLLDTINAPVATPASPANVDASSAALKASAASVVRITGSAYECGETLSGSGFVVSDDRVVTNAHVVAGVDRPVVEAPGKAALAGRVVYFDAATDLAVIRVPGLSPKPLALGPTLKRGDGAAIQGYPFGGPFSSLPATVDGVSVIASNDESSTANREVFTISADVEQGDSGGPLLATDGTVAGVVFAKSTATADIGYALTLTELAPVAKQAPSLTTTVSSGACAQH